MANRKLSKEDQDKLAQRKADLKLAQVTKKDLLETVEVLKALDEKKHRRAIWNLERIVTKNLNIQIKIAQDRIAEIETGKYTTSIQLSRHETGGL